MSRVSGKGLNVATLMGAALLLLSSSVWAATITVNSNADTTADDGSCTLREAMLSAQNDNASGAMGGECAAGDVSPSFDFIQFNISGAGPHVIQPQSALPVMSGIVFIDGDTQPGTNCVTGDLRLVLDGSMAGSASGFEGSGATAVLGVRGFVINNFSLAGIDLQGVTGGEVFCNFIGTNTTGTAAAPNLAGIIANNSVGVLIGTPLAGDANLISGNTTAGILFESGAMPRSLPKGGKSRSLLGLVGGVFGNKIGTNFAGTFAVPNTDGVVINEQTTINVGGTMPGEGNLISGNTLNGVSITSAGATTDVFVLSNSIGTNDAQTAAIGNGVGINIANADFNLIADNVISGNAGNGVQVFNSDMISIVENVIGTDDAGTLIIPNLASGVSLSNTTNAQVGNNTAPTGVGRAPDFEGNDIRFNGVDGIDVAGTSVGLSILGNRVEDNGGSGVDLGPSATASMDSNCFAQNVNGVTNANTALLVAENNWWGHPTGPTGFPGGFGDSIVGNVDADPFDVVAPTTCSTLTPAVSGFNPMSVDFGMVPVGMPATPEPVVLTNNGTVPMEIFTIAIAGGPSDFSVTNQTCPISPMTLGPGSSCTFDVGYTPSSMGVAMDAVSVTNNSQAGTEMVAIMGEGVAGDADLEITGSDTPDPVGAGGQLVYTLNATNLGPSAASMTQVLVSLPQDVTYVSNDCGQAPPQMPGLFEWSVGTLGSPFPNTDTCNVTVSVAPFAIGTITAIADIFSSTADSNLTNNTVNIDTLVQQQSDLFVTKDDGQGTYVPGDTLNYTITVGNNGPGVAFGSRITDFFPPEITSVSWTCLPTRGISNCVTTSGTGDIDVIADLVPGTTVTIQAQAQVSSASIADPLVNMADVTVPQGFVDPMPSNNTAMDSNSLTGQGADLTVTKNDGQTSYMPGDQLSYLIQVRNLGPADVTGAQLRDLFAPEFESVSWTCNAGPGASCGQASGNGNILVSLNIPAGGQVSVTASADVRATASADPLINSALITVPQGITDPNTGNNVASDLNTLAATQVDLAVTKTSDADTLNPGDVVVYTITVANDGPDDAVDAQVSDFFPNSVLDVTWNCDAQNGASCPASGDGDIDHLVDVPAGGLLTYIASGVVAQSAGSAIVNDATAAPAAGTVDTDTSNNTATDTTPVAGAVNLVLDKEAGISPAIAGASLPYLLMVENQGGADASNVVLVDELPDAVTFVNAMPEQGSCDHADGIVTCQLGTLAAAQGTTVTITVDVASDAVDDLLNAASVTSDEDDGNPDDNSDTAQTPILSALMLAPLDPQLPNAIVNQDYQVMFQATGGTDPVSVTSDGAVPGLTFEQVPDMPILILSGTPTDTGSYSFNVTAVDADDPAMTVERNYQLNVVGPLIITPTTLETAVVGAPYSVQFDSPDGVDPLAFSIDLAPPGLALQGNLLAGVPTTPGGFSFQLTVSDDNGASGQRDYVLSVVDDIQIIENPLPIGAVGLPYQSTVTAIGGVQPLQWTATGLPGGLSMSSGGQINGVPGSVGVSNVNVSVADVNGLTDSAVLELIVANNALVNLTPPFPNGAVGFDYTAPIVVTGGQAPYLCDVVSGGLPPGLSLNGCQIGGVPTLAGTFPVGIGVVDSASNPAALQFTDSIRIVNGSLIPGGGNPVLPIGPPDDTEVPGTGDGSPGGGFPDESLQSVSVDAFGFRYLAGFSYNGDNYDVRVIKYGPENDLIWNTALDSGGQDYAYDIALSPTDLNLYVAGYRLIGSEYVGVLQRLDTSGALVWEVINDGGVQVDAFYDVIADASGVYVAGERFNGENFDVLVAKYAHGGALLWENVFDQGDTESGYALALEFCGDTEACRLVAGGQMGRDGDSGWVADYDVGSGARSSAQEIPAHSVVDMAFFEGDLIIAGNNAQDDWGVSRLGGNLATLWSSTYADGDRFRGLTLDREGFIYAAGRGAGSGGQDALIALFSPGDGALQDDYRFDEGDSESFNGLAVTPINELVAAGQSAGDDGNRFLLLTIDTGKTFE